MADAVAEQLKVLKERFSNVSKKLTHEALWAPLRDRWFRARMMLFFGEFVMATPVKPVNSIFAKQLAAMKARWDSQKQASKEAGRGLLPDDRYVARLNKAEMRLFNRKDADGKPISVLGVILTHIILGGTTTGDQQTGKKFVIFHSTEEDEKIMYMQKDFRTLGVEIDDFDAEALPTICADLTKKKPGVWANAKTTDGTGKHEGKKFQNWFLDRAIPLDEVEELQATIKTQQQDTEHAAEGNGDTAGTSTEVDGVEIKNTTGTTPAPAPAPTTTTPRRRKTAPTSAPDPEPVEAEAEPAEVEEAEDAAPAPDIGDPIQFKLAGKVVRGVIKKLANAEGKYTVREDSGGKNYLLTEAGMTVIN